MARVLALDGAAPRPLGEAWAMLTTTPGACAGPGDLDSCDGWMPAAVPGTAASALAATGRWSESAPTPIHDRDVWYRTHFSGGGRERLRFEGLATLCEVWLNGVLVLATRSMFLAHEVEANFAGRNELALCFRSLHAELARPHRRGRWRPRLATPGSLRGVRTSLLGFMPGWCLPVDIVGPYRPITRSDAAEVSADLRASLDGTTGRLVAELRVEGAEGPARLRCGGREILLAPNAPGRFAGELLLPNVAPWWPHTHGEPRLHAVEAEVDGRRLDLGRVGFRTITLARRFEEGLALSVNGVPVFCRGALWTPPVLAGLPNEPAAYAPLIDLAREAGMNMLRVPGITLYEPDAFHDLCDELGILVWQDLMLANFDYPTEDPAFRHLLEREVEGLLDRLQTSPSLGVLSGGSEVQQQAAMLGLPRETWTDGFVAETLPALAARLRPDLIVVPNSPSGGDLPFSVRAGVAHYYGVGAYRRPLEDARRAEVGFAAECLAFANVPEPAHLAGAALADPNSPAWAAAIPRDRGADWDFEEVRDHYLKELVGADPARLRVEDPERYLALARATSAEVMEATFAEWRRARSPTAGGLVLMLRDLAPGAGWGVVDSDGRPKSAWWALKRAFRPIHLAFSDEGLDGLDLHVHNETESAFEGQLALTFFAADGRRVAGAESAIQVPPRGSATVTSAAMLGRFFDATAAYRFGPAVHALGHASLADAAGTVLAEAFHFPAGRDPAPRSIGLSAELVPGENEDWALRIAAENHALGVHVALEGDHRPADNWFHLAPGGARTLALVGGEGRPRGHVGALNAIERAEF